MDVLKDKSYRTYEYISRYTPFPYYYNAEDDKYVYGTTTYLRETNAYSMYEVQRNDSYDSIALAFYNNPELYWVICDFNRILDPFQEPEPGTQLKIPSLGNIVFDL